MTKWMKLEEEQPTRKTAPCGYWVATYVGVKPGPPENEPGMVSILMRDGWLLWTPVLQPENPVPRPALRDGWFWDGDRITSNDGYVAHWAEDGCALSTEEDGIPGWACRALQEDGQL